MRSPLFLGAFGLSLCAASNAQTQVFPFPMDVVSHDLSLEEVVLAPRAELIAGLSAVPETTLTGMFLPDGSVVDLELERINVARRGFRFHVDGFEQPNLLDGLDLSLWKGHVVGEPGTSVMLSFSAYGSRGWVRRGADVIHVMPRPDQNGDWARGDVLLTTEASLNRQGFAYDGDCTALPTGPIEAETPTLTGGDGPQIDTGTCNMHECKISVETDWQLFQVFGNLNAMTTYVTTLLSFVSDRYETQVNTVLTFPYMQFYTSSNDPWTSQDTGGNCIDLLNEFQQAWVGNIPNGGRIGHFLSGANLGCGVAWLDVLCNNTNNFSVSGNMNGNVNFPVVQQPNNWDFMVVAHELGHNFGSPHTHDYCPPLDECPPSQYWGNCQTQQQCTNQGTIMSYCHLCSGGTANITTFFHPVAAGVMTTEAAQCLPLFAGAIDVDPPGIVSPTVPTPVSIQVTGTPTGPVEMLYRYDGGNYIAVALADQGGGTYTGDLPVAACSDAPEFYFQFTDSMCGPVTSPDGAPGNVYSAQVADLVPVFTDDFEADLGWTAQNLGATTGDWERGVPVDDAGWAYDPASDFDGSGSCQLTENQVGNTDVDNGSVRLSTPILDMSGGDVAISYAYFLRLTNDNGTDRILVEISSNGAAGPWTEIARHDTDGGLGWRTHLITSADLAAAAVTQTANMQMRFTTNDDNPQSINESGLDAFDLSILDCGGPGTIGTSYCGPAVPNSTGLPGVIEATGSGVVTDNDVTLTSTDLPQNQFGYFLNSMTQDFVMNPGGSQGNLCLGGSIGRYVGQVGNTGSQGVLSISLDLPATPTPNGPVAVTAGETWNFTSWYRDQNPNATSNFTDAVSILFQ